MTAEKPQTLQEIIPYVFENESIGFTDSDVATSTEAASRSVRQLFLPPETRHAQQTFRIQNWLV